MRELKLHLRRAIPLIVFLALLVHFILPRVGQIEHSASIIPTMIPWWILAAIVAQVLSYVSNGAVLQCVVHLAGGSLNRQIGHPAKTEHVTIAGLGVLAQMAGTSTRTLNGYRRGEYRFIELRAADRLADALDIPLPLLADDFRPQSAWAAAELEVAA